MKKKALGMQIGVVLVGAAVASWLAMTAGPVATVGNVAVMGWCGVLGAFLGIDTVKMVKRTAGMPSGQFEHQKTGRYLLAFVLIAVVFFLVETSEGDFTEAQVTLISLFFFISSLLVGGLGMNKIMTKNGEGLADTETTA